MKDGGPAFNKELTALAEMQELLNNLDIPGQCRVMNWLIDETCEKRNVASVRVKDVLKEREKE